MDKDTLPPHTTKNDILDELESIQNLLVDEAGTEISDNEADPGILDFDELDDDLELDIPILDDVVTETLAEQSKTSPKLLNLDDIFDADAPSITADNSEAKNDHTQGHYEDVALENTEHFRHSDFGSDISHPEADFNSQPGVLVEETDQAKTADKQLEFIIQDLVDEFIPMMEDRLRQRLSQCEPEIIRQLSKKYLNY